MHPTDESVTFLRLVLDRKLNLHSRIGHGLKNKTKISSVILVLRNWRNTVNTNVLEASICGPIYPHLAYAECGVYLGARISYNTFVYYLRNLYLVVYINRFWGLMYSPIVRTAVLHRGFFCGFNILTLPSILISCKH